VDWYLDGGDPRGVGVLRRQITGYLARHAAAQSTLDEAELVAAETIGNAVRHAGGPIWVSLSWRELSPTLEVRDLGPGFDPDELLAAARGTAPLEDRFAESGRGLFLISRLAPSLQAQLRAGGGMAVSVVLPVRKPAVLSPGPLQRTAGSLPGLDEAQPEGGFGKEAFLRALVVQLAQTVELQHGPDAADAAVAQVGIDIGGQMEDEFRAAERIVGRLSPEQMAQCYVRLKHAIDGGFFLVEADEHRIVLGNTRCPFGEAVRQAPSLCRMTSSVFGGIAARNSGHPASVTLEERIAVGDPGCRVVVHLGEPSEGERPLAHRYPDAAV
jgi:anti-sigma regulatory factor (Ser/Thr protein kinase)